MGEKRIPRRVKINDKWYDVREGWAGTLELSDGVYPPKYTAKEPYMHMNNFYFVHDGNNNKVGEIDMNHKSCSGGVTGLEG